MGSVENLESLDDMFLALLQQVNIPEDEKTDLVTDFSDKSLSEQMLMIKIFEGRVKSEQEQIQQRYVESQNKRGL